MNKENKRLRNAIIKAENKLNEASAAIQNISHYVKFKNFTNNEPDITCAGGEEIIAVYNGAELDRNQIIELMESKNCIEPSDFLDT